MRTARSSSRPGGSPHPQGSGNPREKNSWHTLVKILPCPKLRLRAIINRNKKYKITHTHEVHNFTHGSHWQISRAVAYPGFPRGGGANSGGPPTYDFAKFSQKLHEIERIWAPGEALPSRPLDPPLKGIHTGESESKITCHESAYVLLRLRVQNRRKKWNFPLNFHTMRKLSELYSGIFQNYWLFNHLDVHLVWTTSETLQN